MDQQHYAASGSRGPVVMDRAEGGSAFLPLSLPRPERIAQIDVPTVEELEGVPYPYILERLAQSGPSLLQSALTSKLAHGSTTLTPPLPTSLLFDFTPASSLNPLTQLPSPPPNYVLAIRPTPTGPNGSSSGSGSILPIHDIIYRTFCAHLPPIPPRAHDLPENALPIISITLPSPGTLPTLNTYLYTQRPDILLSTLLALPSQAGTSRTRADLTNQLASVLNVPELMQRISLVHGVWGNVCALGVADALLWKALDTSWEILVGAVALRQEMREE
ncbi:hypothetical protein BDY24DRAFT_351995 [Mrakia frigida]|uniref:uncharacterized protein n=1 Tax=Mrakia frigida TaxID=29902 RepID=UPI003FCBF3EC